MLPKNREELHNFIEKQQPNICKVVAYKDNKKVYSNWKGIGDEKYNTLLYRKR